MIFKALGCLDFDSGLCDGLAILIESPVERIFQRSDLYWPTTTFPGSLMHQQGVEAVWLFTIG